MSVLGKRRLSGKSDPPPKKCKTNPFIPPLINLHVSSDDKQWTITVAQGTDISSKIAGLCHMNPHQFKCVDERGDPVLLSSYNLSDNTRVLSNENNKIQTPIKRKRSLIKVAIPITNRKHVKHRINTNEK
eukprot:316045_1